MDVCGANTIFQNAKSLMNSTHQVRVPCVKANSYVFITQEPDQLHQLLRRGQIIRDVLQQQADAQWPGKSAQVLNGAQRRLKLTRIIGFIAAANMLDQEAKRRVFRYFNGALDLVHGLNPVALFHVYQIERLPARTEIIAHIEWRMNGMKLHFL